MAFIYPRMIHFQDTDAAGVVYFANVLAMCHEAYEASLAASGINLKLFFGNSDFAIPIVHASVDFLRPMFCGDRLNIHLNTTKINDSKFMINYQVFAPDTDNLLAKAITQHVCIDAINRIKKEFPPEISQWLQLYLCK